MKRLFHILISFSLVLFLIACAKIGAPAGGPRDKKPPFVEKSKPLNKSLRFAGNKIEITFDEFIKTDAIAQEMVVSPPFKKKPEIRLRGKTLIIEWEEVLRDSTTYTFSFGESIKDLNEGNILNNFEFVFSTGDHLDSLGIIGSVLQAFDLTALKEPVFLMLYENLSDSAPLLEIPDYVGKSDPKGAFLINNVRSGTYRLFALQDMNRNYKYDVPEEFIGFLDSTVYLSPDIFTQVSVDTGALDSVPHELQDSLRWDWMQDSLGLRWVQDSLGLRWVQDSLQLARIQDSLGLRWVQDSLGLRWVQDSVILSSGDSSGFSMSDSVLTEKDDSLTLADIAPWSIFVDIFVFQEDNATQYLIDNSRKDRRNLSMHFNRRVIDTVIMEPYNFKPEGDWYLFEEHIMNDTFVYWLTDSLVYKSDSLTILATYLASDTLNNLVPFHDTLKFNFREAPEKKLRKTRKEEETEEVEEKISIELNRKGSQEQDLFRPIIFELQHPIALIDTSLISLIRLEDSLEIPVSYDFFRDTLRLRRFILKMDWVGLTQYRLDVFPNAFTDIYGLTHDTLSASFRARDPESYGRILLSLSGVRGQKIIQVLDSKGSVFRQKLCSSDGLVEFDYMQPSTYTLKLIHDHNGNGEWDTGDYLEHLQPEEVEFHEENVLIRANFDTEVTWELWVPEDID